MGLANRNLIMTSLLALHHLLWLPVVNQLLVCVNDFMWIVTQRAGRQDKIMIFTSYDVIHMMIITAIVNVHPHIRGGGY